MRKTLNDFPRCNALDNDGRRCKKHSGIEFDYHGDGELYRQFSDKKEVHWVRINLCPDHAIGVGYDFTVPMKNRGRKTH